MNYRFHNIFPLLCKGKSMGRALEDFHIHKNTRFHGSGYVLDIGAGWSSYHEIVRAQGLDVLTLDIQEETRPDVVANLEHGLPFSDNSVAGILLLNVLEHISNVETLIREVYRVLKPEGGKLIITVPYIMPLHRLQSGNVLIDDYWRFSDSTLRHLLRDFSNLNIVSYEAGPFVGGMTIFYYALKFRPIRIFVFLCMFVLDRLYSIVAGKGQKATRMTYPIVYYVEAEK